MGLNVHTPLTFEEHRDLSLELKESHLRTTKLHGLMAGVYGSSHPASMAFAAVAEAIGRLLSAMQGQASEDCPGTRAADLYR